MTGSAEGRQDRGQLFGPAQNEPLDADSVAQAFGEMAREVGDGRIDDLHLARVGQQIASPSRGSRSRSRV